MYNPKCGKVRKLRSCYPVEMFTVLKRRLLKKSSPTSFEGRLLFLLASTSVVHNMLHDRNLVEESHASIGLIVFEMKKEPGQSSQVLRYCI